MAKPTMSKDEGERLLKKAINLLGVAEETKNESEISKYKKDIRSIVNFMGGITKVPKSIKKTVEEILKA